VTPKKSLIALGLIVVAALIGLVVYYLALQRDDTAVAAAALAPLSPGYTIVPGDRTLGNPKAKVVLIEYAAPSCPVCAAFNAQSFAQVKQNYIDTGKIYYVLRVFPIRADDGTAEKIARCLPPDRYFSFMDLLFRNQPMWDVENGVLDVHGGLVRVAAMAGMTPQKVDSCIANPAEDARINKAAADGEARYHITGTPTFVLNGTPVGQGTLPSYADMRGYLDSALAAK
jgi:protein-disulfide isomerase